MASTSRAQLRYILEEEFGVIPEAGNPKNLRMTGESLTFSIQKERSREIRADRMTSDLVPVNASASGGFNFELSYREFDELFQAVFQDTWNVYGTNGVGTVFEATYTSNTITATVAPAGDSAFTNLAKGQWIQIRHPGSPNDKKWVKIDSTTAPSSTVITVDASTPLEAAAASAGCQISASRLLNGVTERTFTLEKAFEDVSQFFAYRGMAASSLDLSFSSGAIVTGSFGFTGKDAVRADETQLPGVPIASLTYDVMNAVSGVGQVYEGGAPLVGTFISALSLSLNNSIRSRNGIGHLGAVSVASGSLSITGSIEVYLANGTLYDKFRNNTPSSISVLVKDNDSNGYVLTLPCIKYGDAQANSSAIDQDVILSMPFEAVLDPVTQKMIILDRAGAVPA